MTYSPPQTNISASWAGLSRYVTPNSSLTAIWASGWIGPGGMDASRFGTHFVTKQQFANPTGWVATKSDRSLVTLDFEFIPREGSASASWVGMLDYSPGSTGVREARWSKGAASKQTLYEVGVNSTSCFGQAALVMNQGLDVLGILSPFSLPHRYCRF